MDDNANDIDSHVQVGMILIRRTVVASIISSSIIMIIGSSNIMKQKINYISHYEAGNESVNVEINGKIRFIAKKVESFNPYWQLITVSGLKFGKVATLADLTDSIESGSIETQIVKAEYKAKIQTGD